MAGKDFIVMILILLFNFLSMIFIVFGLEEIFIPEFIILILAIMIASIMGAGIYFGERWAWRLSSVFFVLNIINMIYIFPHIGAYFLFSIVVIVSVLGFLMSISNINIRAHRRAEAEEDAQKPETVLPAAPEPPKPPAALLEELKKESKGPAKKRKAAKKKDNKKAGKKKKR